MLNQLVSRILFTSLTSGCVTTTPASSSPQLSQQTAAAIASKKLTLKQTLVDNQAGADGLAGARAVAITPDNSQLLVVSADDNSLAVFDIDANFKLSFKQLLQHST